METQKKSPARRTYTTLKECLEDENWQKMYELIARDTSYRLKNHFYDD